MQIYNSVGEGTIQNYTGALRFIQSLNDGDIQFFSDDGSGGTTEYFRVDGGNDQVEFRKDIKLDDTVKLKIGNGGDFKLSHSGSLSTILNETGDLIIKNQADDSDIVFQCDDGSGSLADYIRIDGSEVRTLFSVNAEFSDNVKAKFGSGDDLEIYHDGTDSYVDQTGTGDLVLRTSATGDDVFVRAMDDIFIKPKNWEAGVNVMSDGAVELYYDGNKKFETTSAGADVTGTLNLDNLTIDSAIGSDGQVLTSTGSGIAWEDAAGGGSGVTGKVEGTNFTNSLIVGHTTTGTLSNASSNTAVGIAALDAVEGGQNNVAIGHGTLTSSTTAVKNTAVGSGAQTYTTTGSENTSLGYVALSANTTGAQNTALGSYALDANTTASQNTAVGYAALSLNTTGSNNTAVGSLALSSIQTGVDNVAVGGNALTSATGNYNTAVGYVALYSTTTGTRNTGVGRGALNGNTTGSRNI